MKKRIIKIGGVFATVLMLMGMPYKNAAAEEAALPPEITSPVAEQTETLSPPEEDAQEDIQKEIVDFQDTESTKWWKKSVLGVNVFLLAGLFLVLVLALAATVYILLIRGKRENSAGSANKIFMKLQILTGCKSPRRTELHLGEELYIGRSPKCAVVLKDRSVSKVNSRIFMSGQIIYIEDLHSLNGTFISGMRIHAPNRLRSGDEVTIGDVTFVLKF